LKDKNCVVGEKKETLEDSPDDLEKGERCYSGENLMKGKC